MKLWNKSFILVASIAATSLVSCQKQELRPTSEGRTITIKASVENLANITKSHIEASDGVYNIIWDENETMRTWVYNENEATSKETEEFTVAEDGTGLFTVTIPSGEWTSIAGAYPSSATRTDTDIKNVRLSLNYMQTPKNDSYDPSAYILIARPTALTINDGEQLNASFYRATALNKFTVTNLEHGGNITSVKITFPEDVKAAGYKNFDLTTTLPVDFSTTQNSIELNYAAAPLEANSERYILWFTTWGIDITPDETVKIEVTTEDYTYTKEFTGNTASFKENYLNLLSLDMTGATAVKIDASDDLSGEYLIIAEGKDPNKNLVWAYMTSDYFNTSNNSLKPAFTTISSSIKFNTLSAADFNSIEGIETGIWTLAKTDGGYTIYNAYNKQYLELRATKSNNAYLSSEPKTLSISIEDEGSAKIQNPSRTDRQLRANNNDTRFANYTVGDQKEVYLLPWVESTEPILNVTETSKTVSADATEIVFEYIARNLTGDVTATVASDESQIISGSPVVDAATSTVTITLNPNTDEVEKTATITLSADGVEPITLTVNQKAFVPESTTIKATVAEFLAAEVNDNVWYELTGTITDLYNTEYGNFHLVDETGTVRVYGLTAEKVSSNDKSFSSLGLKEGDIVTLIGTRTEYNNEAQVGGPAYYVSHVVAPYCNVSPSTIPVAADATSATFKVDANVEWKITSNNPTFTVSPASGTEAAEVTVSFPANESDEEVTVILTVSSELGDKTVTINQASASASTVVLLLNEDFTELTEGGNTESTGENAPVSTTWKGNDNFPTTDRAYSAGGTVKIGASKDPGSIESKPLTVPAGTTLTVAFDVKGWSNVEGAIEVTFNGETQTVSYSAVMSGSFESKSVSFVVNSETSSTVKFATTAKRAYLDNIVISYTK